MNAILNKNVDDFCVTANLAVSQQIYRSDKANSITIKHVNYYYYNRDMMENVKITVYMFLETTTLHRIFSHYLRTHYSNQRTTLT